MYGALTATTGTPTATFTFDGEQTDASGLMYLRARYEDPGTGRFVTPDPFIDFAMDTQTLNLYAYALSDPVTLSDPSGLCVFGLPCPIKTVVHAVETGWECLRDRSCSETITTNLDRTALAISGLGAGVEDSLALAGCSVGGVPGCMFGAFGGWLAAAPARFYSNLLSGGSTILSCANRFLDKKEGGFHRSNFINCGASVIITGVGALPESNIDTIAAAYQVCRDERRCPPK